MTALASIVSLGPDDLDSLIEHFVTSAGQNGRDGDPINSPYGRDYVFEEEKARELRFAGWAKALSEPRWHRSWGVVGPGRIVGHVELHGSGLVADRHRCTVGLAIERAYWRRGYGRALMQTCIDWAVEQPEIAWLDLGVFANNLGAVHLYRELGFLDVAATEDRFRVDGQSITDVSMTLRV
jgi:RimJ/RimL family protein N-acetyltransferase